MNLVKIAQQFEVAGKLASVQPIGSGNVNDTYLAVFRTHFSEEKIIVQRINGQVFSKPEWIMVNIRILTNHYHKQLQVESASADRIWQLPCIVPCRNGDDYYVDTEGGHWRALTLIASATAHEVVQSEQHAHEVGSVLGQFHRLVDGLDASELHDTLPGFHITPGYLEQYDQISRSDQVKQSTDVEQLQQFIEERRELAYVLENALKAGELKLRLIHGDPKVSNIMIDNDSGKGTAIIDLDTVKPGLIHYDFGDALRSICNPMGEDCKNLEEVVFDLDLCQTFVRGYMRFAGSFLTENDNKYFYDSVRLITFELGLRFFQDYLAGDVYFRTTHPEHNLERAKVQFKLCESIEHRENQIRKIFDQAK
ncbi:MAG: aminoglycoside phosphotransferase family protein [Opitutales bacterium]|nr:aminoglycoside phosphotransferase family protein [Opitutales bacterium]